MAPARQCRCLASTVESHRRRPTVAYLQPTRRQAQGGYRIRKRVSIPIERDRNGLIIQRLIGAVPDAEDVILAWGHGYSSSRVIAARSLCTIQHIERGYLQVHECRGHRAGILNQDARNVWIGRRGTADVPAGSIESGVRVANPGARHAGPPPDPAGERS